MVQAANPAEDFLSTEIAPSLYPLFPSALRRAYTSADETMSMFPYLQTPGGKFQRGDLIASAAEWEVQRLIETGRLNFEFRWEDYARPTGKHLVVYTPRGKMTISQIADPESRPRFAIFRSRYQLTNIPYLFDQMAREVETDQARKHILLVHGYKNLTFAHFTLPHRLKDEPIFKTDNLLNIPHLGSDTGQGEGPSESPNPEALEHLKKILRDNGDGQ